MKRIVNLIVLLLFSAVVATAQTEAASRLYKEAKADKLGVEHFLKQDFAAVDSTSMYDLGVLFYRDKEYASSGTCWEIALKKVKKHGKAYEQILEALSSAYLELGDNQKIQWLMTVIEEHNQLEMKKECNDYKCKLEQAQYYMLHGDESTAKERIKESLELCRTEEQRIEVEEAYAQLLFDVRDFEGCAQYYLSASQRWKTLGGNAEKQGMDLYKASLNYLLAQRFDLSETSARDAVTCFEGVETENGKNYYWMSMLSWGDALYCQNKNEEALAIYQQGLDGYSQWKPGSEKHGDVLEDMAKVEVRLKKYEEAKAHYQAALDIYKKLKLDTKYSNTYSMLLVCLRKAGDNEGANKMEEVADNQRTAVYQRILDTELPTLETTRKFLNSKVYTNSLNTIAGAYYGIGDYAKAADFFSQYSDNLRGMLRDRFLLMTAKDRQRIWEEQQQHVDEFCYNVAALPDTVSHLMKLYIPTFYDLELLSKGIMLNSSIEFEKVLDKRGDKKLKNIYEQIKANYQHIEELQNTDPEKSLEKVLALKQENISLEQKLMKGCAEANDYTNYLSYTWKDVQQKLGARDVAIEFATVQLSPLDKDTYLVALILKSTGEPAMEVISTKAIIKKLESAHDLYDKEAYYPFFWGFMQKHLDGMNRVFFAPNNLLSNIAVEYLKVGEKTFFETREVYRLSSTKELCREYMPSEGKQVCLFGDIDYEKSAVSKKREAFSFGRLEHSKQEIEGIASHIRKRYKVEMYTGKKATEANFFQVSNLSPCILHISSHGQYLGDAKSTMDEAMENSILALSGINIPGQPADSDGMVSAADVANMYLRQCDLAVLSACETGLGGLGADGVFGLQRGFKNAGVHTLLMSLKSVYDESTALLMVEFYKGLSKGLSKREALVEAQKMLRSQEKYNKGEYWAPFILLDAWEGK